MRVLAVALLVAFLPCGTSSAKEISAGTFRLSGSTGLSVTAADLDSGERDESATETDLNLSGAWYPARNVGTGMVWWYNRFSRESDRGDLLTSSHRIGPLLEYVVSLSEPVSLFASASAGWSRHTADEEGVGTMELKGWFWAASAGLRMFLIPSVSLDVVASRFQEKLGDDRNLNAKQTRLALGLSVYLR